MSMKTHAQGLATAGDANAQYDIFSDHVTRFVHTIGTPSPHYTEAQTQQDILDKMRVDGTIVPEGRDRAIGGGGEIARDDGGRTRRSARRVFGQRDDRFDRISSVPEHVPVPGVSLPMIYRFRPIGSIPGGTMFDLVFLKLVPEGTPLDIRPIQSRSRRTNPMPTPRG